MLPVLYLFCAESRLPTHTESMDGVMTETQSEEDKTTEGPSSGESLKDGDGVVEDHSEGEWSVEDIEDIDLEQQTDDNKLSELVCSYLHH